MKQKRRVVRVVTESTFGDIQSTSPQVYDVYADARGRQRMKFRGRDEIGAPFTKTLELDAVAVNAVLERLRRVRVPAAPEFQIGCDGGFTELHVGDGNGGAKYRWWSATPRGWEPLDKIADMIVALWKDPGARSIADREI